LFFLEKRRKLKEGTISLFLEGDTLSCCYLSFLWDKVPTGLVKEETNCPPISGVQGIFLIQSLWSFFVVFILDSERSDRLGREKLSETCLWGLLFCVPLSISILFENWTGI
jgi:hypothetical protein